MQNNIGSNIQSIIATFQIVLSSDKKKVATVPENEVQWRSDFQSGSRVVKKGVMMQCKINLII